MNYEVINGDNINKLKNYPDNYFDSVVTDPPYGLGKEPNASELMKDWIEHGYHEIDGKGFMGKKWDAFVPQPIFWKEVFRVLKPGGHVLAFYGTRTYDWGVMAMRFAGFEVRDCIQWLYGSGFPKSHNISKAIDKKPNLELVKDWKRWLEIQINNSNKNQKSINEECGFNAIGYARYDSSDYWATNRPTIEKWEKMKLIIGIDSNEWDFICDSNVEERGYVESTSGLGGGSGNTVGNFSGKELSNKSVSPKAKLWDGWGTALKPANEPIVLARKPLEKGLSIAENIIKWGVGGINIDASRIGIENRSYKGMSKNMPEGAGTFRDDNWQPKDIEVNVNGRFPANIILDEVAAEILDEQSVGASRFFYVAKASKSERNKGLDGFEEKRMEGRDEGQDERSVAFKARPTPMANIHPTVKPIKLMQYLVKMITPPNGIVLDPFCGSGTTGVACKLDGFNFVGIEQDLEYTKIAEARIKNIQIEQKQLEIF